MKRHLILVFGLLFLLHTLSCISSERENGLNIHNASTEIYKPDLWILGIGINEYIDWPDFYLENPVNDTKKLVDCLEKQEGKQYGSVHSFVIFDAEATKINIINGFQYFKQAKPNDTVLLYINAHGITIENGTYCFFPYDIKNMSPNSDGLEKILFGSFEIDFSSAVNIYDIIGALNISAQKILFLETCGSGGAINIENLSGIKNDDIIILAACRQEEESIENTVYGSIFTDGFVKKINNHNYEESPLTIEILYEYMYDYVIGLTARLSRYRDTQHPQLFIPDEYVNFIIAR